MFLIYKNIQIEREIFNIQNYIEEFYKNDSNNFVSLDDQVEESKKQFMMEKKLLYWAGLMQANQLL